MCAGVPPCVPIVCGTERGKVMPREGDKLTAMRVRKLRQPGMYGDGRGLWLHIGPGASEAKDPLTAKSWLLRYMLNGRAREMGLGPLHTIGLGEARERAREARKLLLDGIDPLDAKTTERARRQAEAASALTFRSVADKYIRAHRAGWKNQKHSRQWEATLETYAYPVVGELPVTTIDTGHVTRLLEPIWATKPETASRVRGRVEAVLDFARTHGWRSGENPARWKGHLENVLPRRAKVAKVAHHAALAWREIGAFMAHLERQEGISALALRFTILTAARTGEVIGAQWSEFDLNDRVWTVPASRMKAGAEHRVPLTEPVLAILRELLKIRRNSDEFVLPGGKAGRPLSNMAMLALLRRMERGDLTVHGFRSTFRDWAGETTTHPREVVEAALAHAIESKVEAAYRRGDMLAKRRQLMTHWAEFCTVQSESAVAFAG